jgi:hypothetical protein
MTVYHCIDQFVKVNFMATYEKNPFFKEFSGFRIFYWAVFWVNFVKRRGDQRGHVAMLTNLLKLISNTIIWRNPVFKMKIMIGWMTLNWIVNKVTVCIVLHQRLLSSIQIYQYFLNHQYFLPAIHGEMIKMKAARLGNLSY